MRSRIVAAAVALLLREGLGACTVRSIAACAGVSKSSLHYYFAEIDDVVDAAMVQATEQWVAWLRAGAARAPTPARAFWQVVDRCVAPFAQGDRSLLPLWLEFVALRSRQARLEPLRRTYEILVGYIEALLADARVEEPRSKAEAVTAFLFGVSMREVIAPLDHEVLRANVAALCGLAPPPADP